MERLCALADETVCLNVRDGDSRLAIFQVETERPLRYSIKIGQRYPLYAGAAGKVLLAFLSKPELARLRAHLEPNLGRDASAPKSWHEMGRSLADVAARGHAVTHGEAVPEAVGIAAPIFDNAGRIIACVGIYGPEFRLPRARVRELIPHVQDAARAISKSLGAKPRLRNTLN
jgi:DNA-binding IclR family transcriptional regulator